MSDLALPYLVLFTKDRDCPDAELGRDQARVLFIRCPPEPAN
jgi:hypothetical protein